jgi:hypothetical protein
MFLIIIFIEIFYWFSMIYKNPISEQNYLLNLYFNKYILEYEIKFLKIIII